MQHMFVQKAFSMWKTASKKSNYHDNDKENQKQVSMLGYAKTFTKFTAKKCISSW